MDIEKISEKLLESACEFQGASTEAREKCREKFRREESNEQNILRIGVDGMVATLSEKIGTPIASVTEESSYQIGLSASFIRSYYLVTDLFMNGDLIEGLVLLRKQIEVLARIIELETTSVAKLRGKTPNIKHILTNGTGRIYGQLSEVAHFSTPESAEIMGVNVEGVRCGPSLNPQFNENAYGYMDLSHFTGVKFAQWMLAKLKEWYPGTDLGFEHDLAIVVIKNAFDAEVLEAIEEPRA
jgi:hypothetical protein